jgi:hypothetical protein
VHAEILRIGREQRDDEERAMDDNAAKGTGSHRSMERPYRPGFKPGDTIQRLACAYMRSRAVTVRGLPS